MKLMKYMHLCVAAAVVLLLLVPDVTPVVSKRCQSVCSRSDGQEFCQRCRMRIPMRFGKRMDTSRASMSEADDSKKIIQELTDDDDNRFDGSNQAPFPQVRNENLHSETRFLLDSMKNFAKNLADWEREFYDQ